MKNFSDMSKVITEKRSHSDVNQRTSLSHEFMKVIDNNNIYIHFSNKNIIGVTANPDYNTPAGVYAWQLNSYKKEIKDRIADSVHDANKTLQRIDSGEYVIDSLPAKIAFENTKRTAAGHDISVNIVFPYRGDAKFVHILEAKSGLRWFRLGSSERLSRQEFYKNMEILETFILNNPTYSSLFTVGDMSDFVDFLESSENELDHYNNFFAKTYYNMSMVRKEVDRGADEAKRWYLRLNYFGAFATYNPFSNRSILLYSLINRMNNFLPEGRQANMKNVIFREMGYDAIRDDGSGVIFNWDERHQVVFLHSGAYKVKTMLPNTDISRSERHELFGRGKSRPKGEKGSGVGVINKP